MWDLAVGCGPGMPGPYRAAMGKRDVAAGWRAAYMRPLQITGSLSLRGFGGTPDSKVEEGSGALSANSNTAFA